MNNHQVIISVGMPVYNGDQFLEATLKSVVNQTFGDFELIISDNASTDRTAEICQDFVAQDKRIQYHKNEKNLGAGRNYNKVFNLAKGEFFRWQNADDLIAPNLLERCLKTLEEHPDAVLCYGKTKIIDGKGNYLSDYDDNLNLISDSPVERFFAFFDKMGLTNIIYGLMQTAAIAKTARFGNYLASDINFIGELCLYGKFIEIPEQLFFRRMHEHAYSWNAKELKINNDFWDPTSAKFQYQLIRQHYEYYRAVFRSPLKPSDKFSILKFLLRRSYWQKQSLYKDFIFPLARKFKFIPINKGCLNKFKNSPPKSPSLEKRGGL